MVEKIAKNPWKSLLLAIFILSLLLIGNPQPRLLEQIYLNQTNQIKSFFPESLAITIDSELSTETLIEFLNRHPEIAGTSDIIAYLQNKINGGQQDPSTRLLISLTEKDLSAIELQFIANQSNIFYVSEADGFKLFQLTDNQISGSGASFLDLWELIRSTGSLEIDSSLLEDLSSVGKNLFSLDSLGVVRKVELTSPLNYQGKEIVTVISPEEFNNYSAFGTSINLSSKIRREYLGFSKSDNGGYLFSKLRNVADGYDSLSRFLHFQFDKNNQQSFALLLNLTITPEYISEICNNATDDDSDGNADCLDQDCSDSTDCMHGDPELDCFNNIDEDGNGLTDCQDPHCQSMGICINPTPTESTTEFPGSSGSQTPTDTPVEQTTPQTEPASSESSSSSSAESENSSPSSTPYPENTQTDPCFETWPGKSFISPDTDCLYVSAEALADNVRNSGISPERACSLYQDYVEMCNYHLGRLRCPDTLEKLNRRKWIAQAAADALCSMTSQPSESPTATSTEQQSSSSDNSSGNSSETAQTPTSTPWTYPTEYSAPFQSNCGNFNIDPEENCDDGNSISGDGCSSSCLAEKCDYCSLTIYIDGHSPVNVPCEAGDWSCQAHYVCNAVTGTECIWQSYDCQTGNSGSWYPPDGQSGSSNFNFAYTYELAGGSYGNICACDQSQMSRYGLAANNQYCGLGLWCRDGINCLPEKPAEYPSATTNPTQAPTENPATIATEIITTYPEECTNSVDDDRDGQSDCQDSDCSEHPNCRSYPTEICDNFYDDDLDGYTDCGDSDCICNDFPEDCWYPGDEDRNGLADCEDPFCLEHEKCRPLTTEICNNSSDDDWDGLTDCSDPDCSSETTCLHGDPELDCHNEFDDDWNGYTDCEDLFCQQIGQCPEGTPTPEITPTISPTPPAPVCPGPEKQIKYLKYLEMTPEERLANFTPDELYEFAMLELGSTGIFGNHQADTPPDCSCTPGTTAKFSEKGWSCSCAEGEFYEIYTQRCRNKLEYCESTVRGSVVTGSDQEWSCTCPEDLVYSPASKSCESKQIFCALNYRGTHFVDYSREINPRDTSLDNVIDSLLSKARESSTQADATAQTSDSSLLYQQENSSESSSYSSYDSYTPDLTVISDSGGSSSDNTYTIDNSYPQTDSGSGDAATITENNIGHTDTDGSHDRTSEIGDRSSTPPTWGCECDEYQTYVATDRSITDAARLNDRTQQTVLMTDSSVDSLADSSIIQAAADSSNDLSGQYLGSCEPIVYDCTSAEGTVLSFIPTVLQAIEKEMYDAGAGEAWKAAADSHRISLNSNKGSVPPGMPADYVQRCECPENMKWNNEQERCEPDDETPDSQYSLTDCSYPYGIWVQKESSYANPELHGKKVEYECKRAPWGMRYTSEYTKSGEKYSLVCENQKGFTGSVCISAEEGAHVVEKDENGDWLFLDNKMNYFACDSDRKKAANDPINKCTEFKCGSNAHAEAIDEYSYKCVCESGKYLHEDGKNCSECPRGGTYDASGPNGAGCYSIFSNCEISKRWVTKTVESDPYPASCPMGQIAFTKFELSGNSTICCPEGTSYLEGLCAQPVNTNTPEPSPDPSGGYQEYSYSSESANQNSQVQGTPPSDPECVDGYSVYLFGSGQGCCQTGTSWVEGKCTRQVEEEVEEQICHEDQHEQVEQTEPLLTEGPSQPNPTQASSTTAEIVNGTQTPQTQQEDQYYQPSSMPPQPQSINPPPVNQADTKPASVSESQPHSEQGMPVFETENGTTISTGEDELNKTSNPAVAQKFNQISEKVPEVSLAINSVRHALNSLNNVISEITAGRNSLLDTWLGPSQQELDQFQSAIDTLNNSIVNARKTLESNKDKLSFDAYTAAGVLLNGLAQNGYSTADQFISDSNSGLLNFGVSETALSISALAETAGWNTLTVITSYLAGSRGSKHLGAVSLGMATIAAQQDAAVVSSVTEWSRLENGTNEDFNRILNERMEQLRSHVYQDGIKAAFAAEILLHLKEIFQFSRVLSPASSAALAESIQTIAQITLGSKLTKDNIDSILEVAEKIRNDQEISQLDLDKIITGASDFIPFTSLSKLLKQNGINTREIPSFNYSKETNIPLREDISLNISDLKDRLGHGVTREAYVNPLNENQVIVIGHNYDPINIPESKPTRENAETYYNHVKDLASVSLNNSDLAVTIAKPAGVARIWDENGNPNYGVIMERSPNNLYDYVSELNHAEHTSVLNDIHSKLLSAINAYAEKGYILKDLNAENIGFDPVTKNVIIYDLNECVTPTQFNDPSQISWLDANEMAMSKTELFNHLLEQSIKKTNRLFEIYIEGVGVPKWID